MSNLIAVIQGLAKFETHEVDGLGKINIRKPGLADLERIAELENEGDDDKSTEDLQKTAKMVALEFIVDDQSKPVFNDSNINQFMALPMDNLLDVLAAFKKTFETISKKSEDLEKKL